MRVATFDVGTNTVLATVVERLPGGRDARISDRARITRLGEGVDRHGRLAPAAIARTLGALRSLAEATRADGATLLVGVGTSALRDAADREIFVAGARAILDRFDVVPGTREAALTHGGALFGLPAALGPVTVVDIGGGSTEIVRGEGEHIVRAVSLDVGAVRLYERHLADVDRPSDPALSRVRDVIDAALADVRIELPLVMLAGTATNVAAVALARDVARDAPVPHGETLSRSALDGAVARITSASRAERAAMVGIEPGRSDVLVAGALLFSAIVDRASAGEVLISDGGVRFGLAREILDAADRRAPEPC